MSEGGNGEDPKGQGIPRRSMEIAVAVLLMVVASVVMIASYRLGAGWAKDVGPDSGYFPFYVALIMFVTSGVTLVQQLVGSKSDRGAVFVTRSGLKMVLQVLIPMTIFVVLAIYIGIYISMAMFICFFMMWHGNYSLYRTLPVMLAVPIVLFLVFEVWFLVPLPKGPFEAWLGY